MANYFIEESECVGCGACIMYCRNDAIVYWGWQCKILDSKCVDCGQCIPACPVCAIYDGRT